MLPESFLTVLLVRIEENKGTFVGALVALDREEPHDSGKTFREFYAEQGIKVHSIAKISVLKK